MIIGEQTNYEGQALSLRANSNWREGIVIVSRFMTVRVAGRLHTAEVTRSSIDKSKAAQRAKRRNFYNKNKVLPHNTLVLKWPPIHKEHMAVTFKFSDSEQLDPF